MMSNDIKQVLTQRVSLGLILEDRAKNIRGVICSGNTDYYYISAGKTDELVIWYISLDVLLGNPPWIVFYEENHLYFIRDISSFPPRFSFKNILRSILKCTQVEKIMIGQKLVVMICQKRILKMSLIPKSGQVSILCQDLLRATIHHLTSYKRPPCLPVDRNANDLSSRFCEETREKTRGRGMSRDRLAKENLPGTEVRISLIIVAIWKPVLTVSLTESLPILWFKGQRVVLASSHFATFLLSLSCM